ncbi:MAG: PHP domain-containing protein [Nanoarchaeota archaeon]|nr:PHP domain-containing protein [Nanoarchaeota archaeon]
MLKNVFFQKPDFKAIKEQGYLAFDMHIHSKHSDGLNTIDRILRKAKKLGIGVAITDHNTIKGSLKAFNNKYNVPVIPGVEVTTKEGIHILLYFYNIEDLEDFYIHHLKSGLARHPYMTTNIEVKDLFDISDKYQCIVTAAHPESPTRMGLKTAIKRGYVSKSATNDIAAVEAICGSHPRFMNKKSTNWAWELDKPVTGGSDAHTLLEVGRIVSYAKAENYRDFLAQTMARKNFVVGKEPPAPDHLIQYLFKLYKYMYYPRSAIISKYGSVVENTITHHIPRIKIKIKKSFNKSLKEE